MVLNVYEPSVEVQSDLSVNQRVEQDACPFLALRDDPDTHASYPRTDHICRIVGVRIPTLEWQTRHCLGSQYKQCPYFCAEQAESLVRPAAARRLFQRPSWTISATVVGLGMALVVGAMITLMGRDAPDSHTPVLPTRAISGQEIALSALPTSNPPLAVAATLMPPTVAPVTTVVVTPSPVAEATAVGAITPVGSSPSVPASTPPSLPTHTVAAGETLTEIAEEYHMTVEEIVQLNALDNPNTIPVGLVLRLPASTNHTARES